MSVKISILAAKQHTVERGHPWIFPKAIAKISGKPQTGDLVAVYSESGDYLAIGAYNEHSLYRIRVLALAYEELNHYPALITYRLKQALQLRHQLQLPNPQTNAYRLFNSEADGLSGLTIDRFNHVCVVSSSAYWVELNKDLIKQILSELLPQDRILWLAQSKPLTQDGWMHGLSLPEQERALVLEEGICYQVLFGQAQKTGLFLDQRENHARIARLAPGKKVLDLYTYTGGFALHAAKAGALQVTAVDSSAQAIEQARQNALLNELDTINFVVDDARNFLTQAADYDIIILDPPKLVPSQRHIQKAKNYYRFLHAEVFKQMKKGSLLMTCNCSSALSAAEFTALVCAQGAAQQHHVRIIGTYGPASCHPTLNAFPEGNYLTAVLLAV